MRCEDFKKSIDVIHRSSDGLGASREQLERHARECSDCGRLIGVGEDPAKSSLSLAMKQLVLQDARQGLPPAREALLMEAFRSRHQAAREAAPAGPGILAALAGLFSLRGLAVTATAVAVLAFSFWSWKGAGGTSSSSSGTKLNPSPSISLNPEISVNDTKTSGVAKAGEAKDNGNGGELSPLDERLVSTRSGRSLASSGTVRRGRVTADLGQFEVEEPAVVGNLSDFVAFDYAEHMAPPDAVRLMRVQMPPSRLVNMGVPVPVNLRSREMVNTDLLVGSDGNPRAIRVVY